MSAKESWQIKQQTKFFQLQRIILVDIKWLVKKYLFCQFFMLSTPRQDTIRSLFLRIETVW